MEKYLKEYHGDDITNLLNDSNDNVHVSVNVNLTILNNTNNHFYEALLSNTHEECLKWNAALLAAQIALIEGNQFLEPNFQVKENCHIRFTNLPLNNNKKKKSELPNNTQVGQFDQVMGTVVRMTQSKLLEIKREYICGHCKKTILVEGDYTKMFAIEPPNKCTNPNTNCKGAPYQKHSKPLPEYCIDYQEIRIQEVTTEKTIPSSLVVTLDNDLVHCCQPGDFITVCGKIGLRWTALIPGTRPDVTLTMQALSVVREEKYISINNDITDHLLLLRAEWQDAIERHGEQGVRDIIVQSICPDIYGMYLVKLAIALVMCSNISPTKFSSGGMIRGNSHLLLIGDPGMAKSQLLKFASNVIIRSVHTTGMGCSAAGLTAAVIKEDGEWQLDAGALVLADSGICCIDEFNMMRETDKSNIHEAMEQQTVSIAKAGLVCKLRTRCAIIAATNPKHFDPVDEPTHKDFGIGTPLLSRFDIIFLLKDSRDHDWENNVINHILGLDVSKNKRPNHLWNLERLQNHFLSINNVLPELTSEANEVLSAYYRICRTHENRDTSRTSVRFLDSLVRLSQAHARLLFRNKVTLLDGVTVVRLMESSWGYGSLLKPLDILRKDCPLGPNTDELKEILKALNLSHLFKMSSTTSKQSLNLNRLKPDKEHVNNHNQPLIESTNSPRKDRDHPTTSKRGYSLNQFSQPFDRIDNLDEILSLESIQVNSSEKKSKPKVKVKKNASVIKESTKRKPINKDSIHSVDDIFEFDQFEYKKAKMKKSNNSNRNGSNAASSPQSNIIEPEVIVIHHQTNSPIIEMEKSEENTRNNTINTNGIDNHKKKIGITTLNKLKIFENTKYCDGFPDKDIQINNGDSAYDTAISPIGMSGISKNSQKSRSSILAKQNQDLSFLDDFEF